MRIKWSILNNKVKQGTSTNDNKQEPKDTLESSDYFTGDLTEDIEKMRQMIGHNSDVHFRDLYLGETGIRATIVFVDGVSDRHLINKYIINSLMYGFPKEVEPAQSVEPFSSLVDYIKHHVLSISQIKQSRMVSEIVLDVLKGSTALLIEGSEEVLNLGTGIVKSRNIEEPISEPLVRGPRVGFTEVLRENTALLRNSGKNKNLSFEKFLVGQSTEKELVVAYIKNIANTELVEEVKRRIKKIDIDDVLESGYVEQLIEDNVLSPFPQIQSTERPDRVIGGLLEGRVAILLDGTPFALILPVTFSMLLQSPEDYYERWIPGTLIRVLRFWAAFFTLTGPALYISFISFHPGLIPTKLTMSIIATREGVPFPSLIEALLMEIAIEVLREAGLRLPKPVGPAIGIVGGLIIGEAAVQAGIVSPIMVIVVAVTAISSFTIPQYSAGVTLRILRFVAMFSAATYGLFGVILFFLFLGAHMVKLKSFGVPYVSPAVPYRVSDWKDFIFRMPILLMKRRPKMMHTKDSVRKS
jgi:spore germination protein